MFTAPRARVFAFCLPLLAALSACEPNSASTSGQRPAAAVKVQTLAPQVIEERLPAIGSLLAKQSVLITSTVSEKVRALHFDEGQYVNQGDLLATLEQAEEQAQLSSAKADLAEQQREIRRLKNLLASQSAAQNEYDQRLSARDRAEAKIAEVQAKIDERTLRAPFGGVAGLHNVSPGALVSAGDSITSLDDLSTMRLDLNLPSLLLRSIRVGMTVDAHSDALNKTFQGKIMAINPRIDPLSRSVMVRAHIPNADGNLMPGMLMRVSLLKDKREGIVVPSTALQSIENRHYVWLVDADQKAERREVQLGIRRADSVEVTSGLKAGEQLISEGYLMLRPGSPVAPQES
jgi:membrane fusion protein (multidrug efflux system)